MSVDYRIPREQLFKFLPSPKDVAAFERMTLKIGEASDASSLAVAATDKLIDAAFVTLSANAELPNERVMQFGTGITGTLGTGTVALSVTDEVARAEGGFRITFVSAGDALLTAPLSGKIATQEWVNAQGFGAGGGGSGAASVDDGTASATGGFSLNEGGA